MSKIKALLLTQGMHGMLSQVEGLAKALNLEFKHQTITLKKFWNLIPPKFTPITENILVEKFSCDAKVIISCGRKSVIPSIVLKNFFEKKNNKKIFNIHIQDPKISPINFDFIITPEHDSLKGDNIIKSKGAIHYISNEEIEMARQNTKSKNSLTVVLGGPNQYYSFSLEELKAIFHRIDRFFSDTVDEVKIIASRRTPEEVINFLKEKYLNNSKIVVDSSLSRQNYVQALAEAKKIIMTSDSISMISEAATTGTPIYLAQLKAKKNDYRFNKFVELFKSLNITKDLDTNEEHWTYDKLYETKRIADLIKNKIL